MKKGKLVHWFIIGTFVSLYLAVSVISTLHVIRFFELSNPYWLSVSLAIAFELGAAASLASLIVLDKMNKALVWSLFIVLTLFQSMGNVYYAYVNLHDFSGWVELFDLVDEELIYQKRILSMISGGILPFVALGFIKSLVDYIRPSQDPATEVELETVQTEEQVDSQEEETSSPQILDGGNVTEKIQEPEIISYSEPDPEPESEPEIETLPIPEEKEEPKKSPEIQSKKLSSEEIETIIGFTEMEEDEEEEESTTQEEEIVDANKPIPIFNKDPNQSY
jgi:hypothetical protein